MRSSHLMFEASEQWKLWIKILILAAMAALRLNIITADTPGAPRLAPLPVDAPQAPDDHVAGPADRNWWCNG
jgi:hypothetical protein